MKSSKYIPVADLPLNAIPVTEDVDNEMFNSHGYHCEDLTSRGILNILSLGCSWTQGNYGDPNPYPAVASKHFAAHFGGIKVANWNMGLGARSSDYMSRTLMCVVDHLKPDAVLLTFPSLDRREYFRNDGRKVKYILNWINEDKNGIFWERLSTVDKGIIKHMNQLISPYEDSVNFLKNYKLIESILVTRGIPWVFSMVGVDYVVAPIEELMSMGWISTENYLGTPFEVIDWASATDHHPGSQSHSAHGVKMAAWIISRHQDQLSEKVSSRLGMYMGAT